MKLAPELSVALVHTPFNWRKPLTIISYLIRKVTGSYWNHCAVLIEINNVLFVVESDIKGVVMLPFENWATKNQEIKVFQVLSGADKNQKLLYKVGKVGYSFIDLFWFMPIYLFTGQFYGQKVDGFSNKPTCYEFVAWWLGMKDWYRMTPTDFEMKLKYHPSIVKEVGTFYSKNYLIER